MAAKKLTFADLYCLGINCVVGSGIFLMPGLIAANLGPAAPAAFFAGALLCVLIALCFAEMAAMIPSTGGAYTYVREAFGERVGFAVGWVMWLSGVVGWASVAVGFGELASGLIPLDVKTLAVVLVVLLGTVNFLGTRPGAWSNDLLAVLKLLPLLVLAGWLLARLQPGAVLGLPDPGSQTLTGFLFVLYAYSGFEWIAVPAGEVENPQRNVPLAIISVLVTAGVLYMAIQAGVSSLGLGGSERPLADASRGIPLLEPLIVAAGLASLASVNAAIAFTTPRTLWALAHHGWFPPAFDRLHGTFGSPTLAVLASSVGTGLLVLSGSFEQLVSATVLVSLLQYLAAILALLRLRFSQPSRERPFRLPLGPTIPLLALVPCGLLLATSDPQYVRDIGVALAVGLVLAWVGHTLRGETKPRHDG